MSYTYDGLLNDFLATLSAPFISILRNRLQRATKTQTHNGVEELQQVRQKHAQLWDKRVGSMISQMMDLADYSEASQSFHRSFFSEKVAYSLGPYPGKPGAEKLWKSFMTDDHTPLELSWSWSARDSTPAVRYAAEPISWLAGSSVDPMNTTEGHKCLQDAFPWSPNLDLKWHNHFFQQLVTTHATNVTETAPANHDAPSQIFIAFDLEVETMMVKFYFMPSWKAASLSKSNATLAVESILSLPGLGQGLKTSLGVVVNYISSFPAKLQPQVEILAVDCLEPRQSRIKIYVRFQQTSFDSMIDAMSLGGALPSFSPGTLQDLRDLWCSCFGVNQTSSPIANIQHRTAGLLYYYELRENRPLPTSKVYLPVRHYASNDDQVARGVSDFLWKRGMTLKGGMSYYDGLSQLCKHRPLGDGLGFQSYITCAVKGDEISINSYINPQVNK